MNEIDEIKWNKRYEVGNLEIDSEHKVFVKLIQKIICAVNKRKKRSYIERLINEIYKYADFHFYSEETVMTEISYPDMTVHRKEHQELLLELRHMISVIGDNKYPRPMNEFIKFLIDWFFNHTVNVDKKLSDYLNSI